MTNPMNDNQRKNIRSIILYLNQVEDKLDALAEELREMYDDLREELDEAQYWSPEMIENTEAICEALDTAAYELGEHRIVEGLEALSDALEV